MVKSLLVFLVATFLFFATDATAQNQTRTILVLDGSGSMWGQIDGKAKITIAQEVIGELLQSLPDNQELGLTVYGHRRKGDCSDIETIVEPALGQRAVIAKAVNSVKPKGKTPMTDAVIAAAKALRYTENKATVILVSDGIETCNPDPCAAARALEAAGVDFTAHVIGFNIDDPDAIAQMQCIAKETGGTFRTANNAAELSLALAVVAEPVATPEPAPAPVTLRANATDGRGGPQISEGLIWNLSSPDGPLIENEATGTLTSELKRGEYVISVLRIADEATAEARFGVGTVDKRIVLELPELQPPATLEGPAQAVAGSTIQIRWTGPNAKGDFIAVSNPDAKRDMINYTYTKEGPLLDLIMPPEAGNFEIRYVSSDRRKVLASLPIIVTTVAASISAPDGLAAGATVLIDWTGPDYQSDVVAVTEPGSDQLINYSYTRNGSPLELVLPPDPGTYDIVYRLGQRHQILARVPIEVTGIAYSVTAPASAVAGSTVQVAWTGPDYNGDLVAVAEIGTSGNQMLKYTYTREGSPLGLLLPLDPGQYEIRYVLSQDRVVQAVTEIEVTEVSATITAPATAPAGSTVQVDWTGPDYQGNMIAISKVGEPDRNIAKYTYTREGSPLDLEMPAIPGDYVLKYLAGSKRKALVKTNITVAEVSATLSAPDSASPGSLIEVSWTGPDYKQDFVAIGRPGKNYRTYTYTKEGSPLQIKVPDKPGTYEIRYIMRTDRRIIATLPLTVE
jgi:Ca-activated chloride channel homolog